MSACRGPVDDDSDVPCIHVQYVRGQVDAVDFAQYGIEEERVPWTVSAVKNRELLLLAREAATESRLKIGVGVSAAGGIALHHQRLPENEPLFVLTQPTNDQARRIGTNAARLAKHLPLKPL